MTYFLDPPECYSMILDSEKKKRFLMLNNKEKPFEEIGVFQDYI